MSEEKEEAQCKRVWFGLLGQGLVLVSEGMQKWWNLGGERKTALVLFFFAFFWV